MDVQDSRAARSVLNAPLVPRQSPSRLPASLEVPGAGVRRYRRLLPGTAERRIITEESTDFVRAIVRDDVAVGKHGGRVATRFPPEPNGYLHVGHASAICLNFGIAAENGGVCHLRFDDTNPTKEDTEYVEAIIEDVRWLGWDWGEYLYYSSDYFEQLFEFALKLIRDGKAYVCDLSQKEIREYRGTPTEPGRNSPYRDRSVEENISLFESMRAGEFEEGSRGCSGPRSTWRRAI